MREIKFRAWDRNNEVMIYSEDNRNDDFTFIAERGGLHFYYIDPNDRCLMDTYSTLMQYTGLKDRYKKEIYEGDITTNELYKSEGLAFVVYYDNEKGMFKQRPFMFENNGKKLGNTDLALQMDSVENKEVIGNIHENPELLEVTE